MIELPNNQRPFTDKYFIRTNQILKMAGLNPTASMKVFTRGEGKVAGLDEAVAVLEDYTDLRETGEVWVIKAAEYKTKDPLMVIRGPVQSFVELETMYLGVLSAAISRVNGLPEPDPAEIREKLRRLKRIYQEKPIIYFGARHYHWSLDRAIAKAALEGGAVQTSTDAGSANLGKGGVGTTPHFLTVVLGYFYGRDIATKKTAELFDKYMPPEIPRVTLVDTFNREITDSLMVAEYFGKRKNDFRIDTCGENVGEGVLPYHGNGGRDPTFRTGTGVTIDLVTRLRKALIASGFGDYTGIVLSSGFGDEEKAKAFVAADREFKERNGYSLFDSVGIGEVSKARFCTADLFEVERKPFSKVGREVASIDYTLMERAI